MGKRQELKLQPYFELQAFWGFTKHMGGLESTRELIELCHIDEGKHILDVGCGVGRTACYVAKNQGSRVVGVDVSQRMVDRSRERARRKSVENMVEFRLADVQDLPFKSATFDAVIGESVIAFPKTKQRAVNECVRVVKPGGYVGFNETTWVKAPPFELAEYFSRLSGAKPETSNGWKELLKGPGLKDLVVRVNKINILNQWINEIKWLDIGDYLGAWSKFLFLFIKSPACRRFAREALRMPKSIFKIFEYLGYGIYAGRK